MGITGQLEEYDLVILGSGAGAKLLAWTFAERGQRVAAIEPNTSEALVRTSRAYPARTSFTQRRSPIT
jgi:choline dehydrogenase-like flavoprotein